MELETLEYLVADGVVTITLNRPDNLNSMNALMRRELVAAFRQAPEDGRALILTGKGRGFCAGQDLGDVTSFDQLDLERTLRDEYDPILRALRECPIPSIAAINGPAAGAGANLALGADIVVAARSASFLEAFARIGLIPDAGGTYLLPRKIGRARAMGMSLLAEPIPAEKAAEWGPDLGDRRRLGPDGARQRHGAEARQRPDTGLPADETGAGRQRRERFRGPDCAGSEAAGGSRPDP